MSQNRYVSETLICVQPTHREREKRMARLQSVNHSLWETLKNLGHL